MNEVKFILNDKLKTISFNSSFVKPTDTVLNYLRSQFGFKGTKEACGEGDCGACTVVLGELNENKISYKAVNSCLLFVPMLHGKQLITIEAIEDKNGKLHPVQQKMIEHYGSQCGYCTPGIVMNLFAAYKNNHSSNPEEIKKTLSGNLCRCTGYIPIISAAQAVLTSIQDDHFTKSEELIFKSLTEIQKIRTLFLETDDHIYIKPFTLYNALAERKKHPAAHIITGNTDFVLKVTKKKFHAEKILDLSDVIELKFINNSENSVIIGAGTSLEIVKKFIETEFPSLSNTLSFFGSLQIRNIASLGGNIGSASPIGDSLPVLIANKALVHLKSYNKSRAVLLEEFILSYRKTDLKDDELIYAVEIPKNENNFIRSYKISKRKETDISTLSACFNIKIDPNTKTVSEMIIVYGGMAATPKRAVKTEEFLISKLFNQDSIDNALKILQSEFEPISDVRSGAEYRKIAAPNLLQKYYNDFSKHSDLI
jgi:xanthine dehydrogenase small subunit